MAQDEGFVVPRAVLMQALGNERLVQQMEALFRSAMRTLPVAVNDAQGTATGAAQTASQADQKAVAAQGTANGAANGVTALRAPQYVVLAVSGELENERVLTGDTGVTLTDGGAGQPVAISIDVVLALGFTPVDKAGDVMAGLLDVGAGLKMGAWTGGADAPVNGFLEVQDAGGVARKLATIA